MDKFVSKCITIEGSSIWTKREETELKSRFHIHVYTTFSYPAVTEICICSCTSSRIVSTSLLGQTKRCSPLFVHLQTRDKADNPSIHCIVCSLLMCKKNHTLTDRLNCMVFQGIFVLMSVVPQNYPMFKKPYYLSQGHALTSATSVRF